MHKIIIIVYLALLEGANKPKPSERIVEDCQVCDGVGRIPCGYSSKSSPCFDCSGRGFNYFYEE